MGNFACYHGISLQKMLAFIIPEMPAVDTASALGSKKEWKWVSTSDVSVLLWYVLYLLALSRSPFQISIVYMNVPERSMFQLLTSHLTIPQTSIRQNQSKTSMIQGVLNFSLFLFLVFNFGSDFWFLKARPAIEWK